MYHPLITAFLLLLVALIGFFAFIFVARKALKVWDELQTEREAQRRDTAMRRYSMVDLRPVRAKEV